MKNKLTNFYEKIKDKSPVFENIGYNQHHIRYPCRICISGPSSAGKTNSVLNYLKLAQKKKKGMYDKVIIITKKIEPLYEFIKEKNPDNVDIIEMTDKDSVMPKIEDIDTSVKNFIIFDDLVTSKHLNKDIQEYFIRSRKTRPYPISICYLSQNYRDIDPMIRKNCNHFFIFKCSTEREKRVLYQDLPLLKNDELWKRLDERNDINTPSNFLNIDTDLNTIRLNFE